MLGPGTRFCAGQGQTITPRTQYNQHKKDASPSPVEMVSCGDLLQCYISVPSRTITRLTELSYPGRGEPRLSIIVLIRRKYINLPLVNIKPAGRLRDGDSPVRGITQTGTHILSWSCFLYISTQNYSQDHSGRNILVEYKDFYFSFLFFSGTETDSSQYWESWLLIVLCIEKQFVFVEHVLRLSTKLMLRMYKMYQTDHFSNIHSVFISSVAI